MILNSMKPTFNTEDIQTVYYDLFSGAGGTSTGVVNARINERPCSLVAACINHDANAIRSHRSNHKQTLHFTEDITELYKTSRWEKLRAHVALMRVIYPNAKVILWASLECTNFSLSLIHISEPTRLGMISYAVFCL